MYLLHKSTLNREQHNLNKMPGLPDRSAAGFVFI
jgi:hypothetical protein